MDRGFDGKVYSGGGGEEGGKVYSAFLIKCVVGPTADVIAADNRIICLDHANLAFLS